MNDQLMVAHIRILANLAAVCHRRMREGRSGSPDWHWQQGRWMAYGSAARMAGDTMKSARRVQAAMDAVEKEWAR